MSSATAENCLRNLFVYIAKLSNSELKTTFLTDVSLATSKLKYDKFCTKVTGLQLSL